MRQRDIDRLVNEKRKKCGKESEEVRDRKMRGRDRTEQCRTRIEEERKRGRHEY